MGQNDGGKNLTKGVLKMDNFGISKLDLKRRNRTQVLNILRQCGSTSRIDIASELDITRAAVTIITNEMIEQGVIYEKGEANYMGKKLTRGRKKILIDINPNYKFVFGLTVDGGFISIGLTNLAGETLEKILLELDRELSLEEMFLKIVKNIEIIKQNNCLTDDMILGMGVCVSKDHYRDLNIKTNGLIPDFASVKASFEKLVAFPVVVSDTVNSMAQAEIDFNMDGVKPDNVMFIRFGNEIDASVLIDNKPYRGSGNNAVNIAHTSIKMQGIKCPECGKVGCLDTVCSKKAILERVREVYSEEETPALYEATGGNVNNCNVIFTNLELMYKDKEVAKICKEAAEYFVIAVNNAITLFDPQQVVLFGKIFDNDMFFDFIKKHVCVSAKSSSERKLYVSRFDLKIGYLAGCSIAIRELFVKKGGFDRA